MRKRKGKGKTFKYRAFNPLAQPGKPKTKDDKELAVKIVAATGAGIGTDNDARDSNETATK